MILQRQGIKVGPESNLSPMAVRRVADPGNNAVTAQISLVFNPVIG